jgi:hypothetical protein
LRKNVVVLIVVLAAGLVLRVSAFAQTEAPPPGWKTCPHCLTLKQAQEEDKKVNNPGIGYNYGIEFVMLPDGVLQFIEWSHTRRTIWTDGRDLGILLCALGQHGV